MISEIIIQDEIKKKLEQLEIFPYSVFFTRELEGGTLSITFFFPESLHDFLDNVGYKNSCDRSGYVIFEETNTVVISGISLTTLIKRLNDDY